jgi:uncharacterized protein (TIGR03083 family)
MSDGLSRAAYLTSCARDTGALARAVALDPDARVAACPDWDVADLGYHVGEVHRFWTDIVQHRRGEPAHLDVARPPDGELPDWLRAGVGALVEVAESTDPATPIWTWAARKDAGFVPRRMAQETAVHRWDGEAAVGAPRPIDPDLAVDGIDELAEVMLPFAAAAHAGPPIAAHLHCTDAAGEWVIHVADGDLTVEHVHRKQPVAIRGTASDLLLLLWRRVPLDAVEVLGEAPVAEALVALTDLD